MTDILAQARALSEKALESACGYPHTPADWIAAVDTLAAEVERLRGLVANGMGKPGAVANRSCGNCERPIAEGHSSLRCPCRPQLEKAWDEIDRLRAQVGAVESLAAQLGRESSAPGQYRQVRRDHARRILDALDGEVES